MQHQRFFNLSSHSIIIRENSVTEILVTNDDGVDAPGILALATALQQIGQVQVIAPATNQSASGHKRTVAQDIRVEQKTLPGDIPALAVSGSPGDCIALAALGATDWPPRVVVSGINRGQNMGQDITYSGTVSAAFEATMHAIPALAVSLAQFDADQLEDYETAAQVAARVVEQMILHDLPPFTILNLNVPPGDEVKALRLTRQGVSIYNDKLEQDGDIYRIHWLAPNGKVAGRSDEIGTDLWAVHHGYASLTPLHLDMTAHRFMADLGAWDISLKSLRGSEIADN
jgi:5'-nucleotidase